MPNPKMKMWLDAADNIATAPDWFFGDYVWPELDRRKKGDTPKARAARQMKRDHEASLRKQATAKAGWDDCEGAAEYWYAPYAGEGKSFGMGKIRVPECGSWMYVRVPVTGWDSRLDTVETGTFWYWRHTRFDFDWQYRDGSPKENYSLPRGHVYRKKPKKRNWRDLYQPRYTVAECKSQLNKHHPDKGGDPAKAAIWTERLQKARRAAA